MIMDKMRMTYRIAVAAVLLLLGTFSSARAESGEAAGANVQWHMTSRPLEGALYEIVLTGEPAEGWHVASAQARWSPVSLTFSSCTDCAAEGPLYDITEPLLQDGEPAFFSVFQVGQKVRVFSPEARVSGYVSWVACREAQCASPQDWAFEMSLCDGETAAPSPVLRPAADTSGTDGSLWALVLEAILWGLAMLLTPCVFPMVPMTVSFFLKNASTPAAGRVKALAYGMFIILLYTVPISVIILLTRLFGGDAITADIFNWLATHWLPNLVFFVVFMVFAASFFGAFEIVLPASLVNKSDRNAGRGGLGGIFFMALTLVLVSFSCTGPIVGSVLIRSTRGEFWAPMVTMLAFSVAFALPFTLLALFPALLKKLKSGAWLGSVKVVLGFIEVALGFKFLSVADQTYHWGLLDREVYLAIWIVVFSLLGLYLLGKLRFPHESPEPRPLSVFRLSLVIAVFSFVVYLVPGMWGAPLKAL
ncbi:MAG: thiol:disulfide interchange protein, partial [Bacteroidales bacterium]|nr:thiol:disulfide interchange protein [Bacteroidales bacterium]